MSSVAINAVALSSIGVFGAVVPGEGPRAVPVNFNFANAATFTLNYSNQQNLGLISMVQTVFVDNSNSDVAVLLTFGGVNQTIIAKGRTQGYYAVCASNPFYLSITSPGSNSTVTVILLNFPVTSAQWPSQ
jgi:hypothetical protein